jgi:hypothetical protein
VGLGTQIRLRRIFSHSSGHLLAVSTQGVVPGTQRSVLRGRDRLILSNANLEASLPENAATFDGAITGTLSIPLPPVCPRTGQLYLIIIVGSSFVNNKSDLKCGSKKTGKMHESSEAP